MNIKKMYKRFGQSPSSAAFETAFETTDHDVIKWMGGRVEMICGLKRCSGDNSRRKNQEMRLIFELGTLKPNGLNINFSFI